MKRTVSGFTLIELLIGLAVGGTLMGVAVPSMLSAMHAAHSAETRAALLTDLMKASSKAGIHGVRTTLCPSFDGRVCNAGFDWSAGWIAFIDQNGSREREPDEVLISVHPALTDTRLISSSGRTPSYSRATAAMPAAMSPSRSATNAVPARRRPW